MCNYLHTLHTWILFVTPKWSIPMFQKVGPTPYLRRTFPGKRRLERWGISVSIVSAAQRRQAERVERAATLAGMQLSAQGRVTRLRPFKREFEWWSKCKMMVGSLTDCRVISCKIDEHLSNGLKLTKNDLGVMIFRPDESNSKIPGGHSYVGDFSG